MRSISDLDSTSSSTSSTSSESQPDDDFPQDILLSFYYYLTFVDIEDFIHSVLLIPKDRRVAYGAIIRIVLADTGFSEALKKYRWLSTIGNATEADHARLNSHALSSLDSVIGGDNIPWEMKYVFCALDTSSSSGIRIKDSNGVDPFAAHQRHQEDKVGDKMGPRKIRSEETTSRKRKFAWGEPPAKWLEIDSAAPARVDDEEEVALAALKAVRASLVKIFPWTIREILPIPPSLSCNSGLVDHDCFQLIHANRSTVLISRAIDLKEDLDVEMFIAILIGLRKPTLRQLGVTDIVDQHQRFLSDGISHIQNALTLRANVPGKTPIAITLSVARHIPWAINHRLLRHF